jgi:hypothetical protein
MRSGASLPGGLSGFDGEVIPKDRPHDADDNYRLTGNTQLPQ